MPKIGSEVSTLEGEGIVVSVNMLKMQVKVKIDDRNGDWIYKDFDVEDVRFKKPINSDKADDDDKDDE